MEIGFDFKGLRGVLLKGMDCFPHTSCTWATVAWPRLLQRSGLTHSTPTRQATPVIPPEALSQLGALLPVWSLWIQTPKVVSGIRHLTRRLRSCLSFPLKAGTRFWVTFLPKPPAQGLPAENPPGRGSGARPAAAPGPRSLPALLLQVFGYEPGAEA